MYINRNVIILRAETALSASARIHTKLLRLREAPWRPVAGLSANGAIFELRPPRPQYGTLHALKPVADSHTVRSKGLVQSVTLCYAVHVAGTNNFHTERYWTSAITLSSLHGGSPRRVPTEHADVATSGDTRWVPVAGVLLNAVSALRRLTYGTAHRRSGVTLFVAWTDFLEISAIWDLCQTILTLTSCIVLNKTRVCCYWSTKILAEY